MNNNIKIYDSAEELADNMAANLNSVINHDSNKFFLSISGGSTPFILFRKLAQPEFSESIEWKNLDVFWCDERCVPPSDNQSNFGNTKKSMLDKINIPAENIHRIQGENDPNEEAIRYAKELDSTLTKGKNNIPRFDWILLGMGTDGHTASIFPNQHFSFIYSNYCGVATQPESGQKRISLTMDVINNAKRISFIITGKDKSRILSDIIKGNPISKSYPAASVKPVDGTLEWLLDKEAASLL